MCSATSWTRPTASACPSPWRCASVNAIRLEESTDKPAGSVHPCALFLDAELQLFVEDGGRHNAVNTIAGQMALHMSPHASPLRGSLPPEGADPGPEAQKVFHTTGRLTSEMVIKSAQMGVAVVVSRSGITQMGLDLAQRVGLCAIGRGPSTNASPAAPTRNA